MSGAKYTSKKKKVPIRKILIVITIVMVSVFAVLRLMDWQAVSRVRQSISDGERAYKAKNYAGAEREFLAARVGGEKNALPPEELMLIIDKLGNSLREQSQFARAESAYKDGIALAATNSIQSGPELLRLYLDLGETLYRTNPSKLGAANNCFLAADRLLSNGERSEPVNSRQLNRDAMDTYLSLAKVELIASNLSGTEIWLDRAIALLPPDTASPVNPANSSTDNVWRIMLALSRAPQLKNSSSLAALFAAAGLRFFLDKDAKNAVMADRQAIDIADRDNKNASKYVNTAECAYRLAQCYRELKQEGAKQCFERMIDDLKAEPASELNLVLTGQAWNNLGGEHLLKKDELKAMQAFEKGADALSRLPPHKLVSAREYMNCGVWYTDNLKYAEALTCYRKAIEILDNIPQPGIGERTALLQSRRGIANVQWRLGDTNNAKAAAQALEQLAPQFEKRFGRLSAEYVTTLYILGNAYISHQPARSIEVFTKAMGHTEEALREKKAMPDSLMGDAQAMIGQAHINLGQLAPALSMLERSVKSYKGTKNNPAGQINAYLALADLYIKRDRNKDAEKTYLEALSVLKPRTDDFAVVQRRTVLNNYAVVLRNLNRGKESERMEAEAKKLQ